MSGKNTSVHIRMTARIIGCLGLTFVIAGCRGTSVQPAITDQRLVASDSAFAGLAIVDEQKSLTGEYSEGTGLYGANLILSPKGNFVFSTSRDLVGAPSRGNKGIARMRDGVLVLAPEEPLVADEDWQRLPQRLVPVQWSRRTYLIPETDERLLGFCNSINLGYEPRESQFGAPFLRTGDEKSPAVGLPDLPTKWRRYLLAKPVWCKVISVSGESAKIDKGAKSGLKPGMIFVEFKGGQQYRVTEVQQDSANIMREPGYHPYRISDGEQLCTRRQF